MFRLLLRGLRESEGNCWRIFRAVSTTRFGHYSYIYIYLNTCLVQLSDINFKEAINVRVNGIMLLMLRLISDDYC